MTDGEVVQDSAVVFPVGNELFEYGHEATVVGGFEEVNHFVDEDVFEAFAGFFREVSVEADGPGFGGATSPFCFHALDEKAIDFDAYKGLPFGEERWHGLFELVPIPSLHDGFFFLVCGAGADMEDHAFVSEVNGRRFLAFDNL